MHGNSTFTAPLPEIIDAHLYFFSYNFFRLVSQSPGRGGDIEELMWRHARRMKVELPPRDAARLAERWTAELNRHGLARACLVAGVVGDEYSIAEAIRVFPHRFLGLVMVNPHLPVVEDVLEHAVRRGGVRGVSLCPCRHRFYPSDERLYPVYRTAKRHGLPVYIDCGDLCAALFPGWWPASERDPRFSDPGKLHFAATDFPTVSFVVSGFARSQWRELLRLGFLCPNVYVTTCSLTLTGNPAPGIDLADALASLHKAFGPQRVLFGSGAGLFPPGWRADCLTALAAAFSTLRWSDEQIILVLGGNARRLFSLDNQGRSS